MPQTLLRKTLAKIGESYHAPQGVLVITPEKARRYVGNFQKLKAARFRVPVPWGHRLSAIPVPDSVDEDQLVEAIERRLHDEARWNASYVDDLAIEKRKDGDYLVIQMPPPPGYEVCPHTGDLLNPRDGTRIGEVSGAFGNWRDGTGKLHKDVLVHAALCTRPVVGAQTGFELAQPRPITLSTGAVEFAFTLSSSGVATMAKDKDKRMDDDEDDEAYIPVDEPDGDEPEIADVEAEAIEAPSGAEAIAAEEEIAAPAPLDTAVEPNPMTGPGDVDKAKEVLRMFGEMGLALPPDTNAANMIEHLYIALAVAQNMGARFEKSGPDADAADPDANKPPATAMSGMPQEQAPAPEAPPVMMSTVSVEHMLSTIPDPEYRAVVRKNFAQTERQMRKEFTEIWEKAKLLGCPVFFADAEIAKASTITLSFLPNREMKMPQKLAMARKALAMLEAMNGVRRDRPAGKVKPPVQLSTGAPTRAKAPANPAQQAGTRNNPKVPDPVMAALRRGASSEAGISLPSTN